MLANMTREGNRSTLPWEKLNGYIVYLRMTIVAVSCITIISAASALSVALKRDESAVGESGGAEGGSSSDLSLEASMVAGEVLAVAAMTTLVQAALILVTKLGSYDIANLTHLWVQIVDILASSVLLAGCTAGAVAAAVVVHQLVQSDSGTPEDDEDNLYRAVTGIAVFGFLLVIVLLVLCVWSSCILYSLKNTYCRSSRNTDKSASSSTKV